MVWSGNKAPQQTTEDGQALAFWMEDELERFASDQNENLQALDLRPVFNPPLRPRQGMITYADGAKWNPGYGEGAYFQNAAGVWVPMWRGRELLLAARTYYVLPTGLDTNTGLVNSAGGAFLTLQKAINTVANLDLNGNNVLIQAGTGTYTEGVTVSGPWFGIGIVTLAGDTTTPSNCTINAATTNPVFLQNGATLTVQGFKLISTGNFGNLVAQKNSVLTIGGPLEFGASGFGGAIAASSNALVSNNSASHNLSGCNASAFFISPSFGGVFQNNIASAWSATANFSVFAFIGAQLGGICEMGSVTFPTSNNTGGSGAFTITGSKYRVSNGGILDSNGGGINAFPGTTVGTGTNFGVAPWGLYL